MTAGGRLGSGEPAEGAPAGGPGPAYDELLDDAPADAGPSRALPPHIREQIEAGNAFNRERRPFYANNEVRLDNNKVVDSYTPGREIVERKFTQLGRVQPQTAIRYLRSLGQKYPEGRTIADTPANKLNNPGLIGQRLEGEHILEVPVQQDPIPPDIINESHELGVTIRDVNGKRY
jgi:hypothetical protein